jgi:hypothetical protein
MTRLPLKEHQKTSRCSYVKGGVLQYMYVYIHRYSSSAYNFLLLYLSKQLYQLIEYQTKELIQCGSWV